MAEPPFVDEGLPKSTLDALTEPLNPARVKRFTSGPQAGVRYLEHADVVWHANRIFGPGNWGFSAEMPVMIEQGSSNSGTPYEVWACRGTLAIRGGYHFSDVGTNVRSGGGASGLEMAYKGAASDSLKRCLKHFGDQFGLILDLKPSDQWLKEEWERFLEDEQREGHAVSTFTPEPEREPESDPAESQLPPPFSNAEQPPSSNGNRPGPQTGPDHPGNDQWVRFIAALPDNGLTMGDVARFTGLPISMDERGRAALLTWMKQTGRVSYKALIEEVRARKAGAGAASGYGGA